jgi:hypothetical protein
MSYFPSTATEYSPPSKDPSRSEVFCVLISFTVVVQKKWTVNGPIEAYEQSRYYFVDLVLQNANIACLDGMKNGEFILLMGARASGKTTRLFSLKSQLSGSSYRCI